MGPHRRQSRARRPAREVGVLRTGDSKDAYIRTFAYNYLDANGDGSHQHSYNESLVELGFTRTTDFSREHRREFERLREEAEETGAGLWGACPEVEGY